MAEKKACWLRGHGGPCSGKRNNEHYISRGLLEILAGGERTAILGGLPFQKPNTLGAIGINALGTRIYCEGHNSRLSPLDATLTGVFRFVHLLNQQPDALHAPGLFQGALLERALLKVVVGVANVEGQRHMLADEWKALLVGKGTWPPGQGLYLGVPNREQIHDGTFNYETRTSETTGRIALATFFLAGITVHLLLASVADRARLGVYRGRGYIFKTPDREARLELNWRHEPSDCIMLTRVGTTEESAPHARGWKTAE